MFVFEKLLIKFSSFFYQNVLRYQKHITQFIYNIISKYVMKIINGDYKYCLIDNYLLNLKFN